MALPRRRRRLYCWWLRHSGGNTAEINVASLRGRFLLPHQLLLAGGRHLLRALLQPQRTPSRCKEPAPPGGCPTRTSSGQPEHSQDVFHRPFPGHRRLNREPEHRHHRKAAVLHLLHLRTRPAAAPQTEADRHSVNRHSEEKRERSSVWALRLRAFCSSSSTAFSPYPNGSNGAPARRRRERQSAAPRESDSQPAPSNPQYTKRIVPRAP